MNGTGDRVLVKRPPDLIYFVLVVLLVATGSVMLYSAGSAYYSDSFYFLKQHLMHILFGSVFAVIVAFVMTPKLGKIGALIAYGGSLVLLALVLLLGFTSGGAKRWLDVGGISVQPSEIAKTGLILILAFYFSVEGERLRKKDTFRKKFGTMLIFGLLIPMGITGSLAVPVLLEKHISATVIIVSIGVVMMFLGGTSILLLAGSSAAAGGVLYIVATTWSYAKARIDSLFNRGRDVSGSDWQTTEGLYAMGTGGLFGRGLGNSRLKYGYVAEPQNDFIFAVICEELGFIGTLVIMILFFALTTRGLRLSSKCTDDFCSLVIAGLSFKIAVHVLLNIGVVCAVLPNTGISLPFFSSGGSATMVQIVDAGILLGCTRYCLD